MIRQHLPERIVGDTAFRWRGGDVSRLEGLSDAVFAFAMTLLVVSLEVPNTFAEMVHAMWQFPAFAFGFAMLLLCWYHHYLFHRRFGFEDFWTFLLNGLLLFVILFYVYPLKFMATLLQTLFSGHGVSLTLADGSAVEMIQNGEMDDFMVVYGCGFVAIFALYGLMYVHAWRKREALQLNDVERYQTKMELVNHFGSCAIGLLSIGLAFFASSRLGYAAAGWTYFLMCPFHWWLGVHVAKRVEALTKTA